MDALLALAAGAIGSLVTLGIQGVLRYFAARREIEAHDRRVGELDADLERWVIDDDVRLRRELRTERAALSARGAFYSGDYGYRLGLVKERALQAYRDQRERAQREAAQIYDRETWAHDRWRNSLAGLDASRARPVLDAWRLPPSKHLSPGDEPPVVDDPTGRSLAELVASIEGATDDYV
jgi:hypothetical protein